MKNRSLYKNHDGKKHDNNLCKIAVPPDNSHIPLRKDMCSLQAGLRLRDMCGPNEYNPTELHSLQSMPSR